LEIWPGFYSALNYLENGILLQIDLTSKVLRNDNVLKYLQELEYKNYENEKIN
jgi:hypothetical protein